MTKKFFNIKEYANGAVIASVSRRTTDDNCYTGYTTDTVYSNGTSDRTYWGFFGLIICLFYICSYQVWYKTCSD